VYFHILLTEMLNSDPRRSAAVDYDTVTRTYPLFKGAVDQYEFAEGAMQYIADTEGPFICLIEDGGHAGLLVLYERRSKIHILYSHSHDTAVYEAHVPLVCSFFLNTKVLCAKYNLLMEDSGNLRCDAYNTSHRGGICALWVSAKALEVFSCHNNAAEPDTLWTTPLLDEDALYKFMLCHANAVLDKCPTRDTLLAYSGVSYVSHLLPSANVGAPRKKHVLFEADVYDCKCSECRPSISNDDLPNAILASASGASTALAALQL
jgi:hypothetical protein